MSSNCNLAVSDEGLTILHDPQGPIADIVFIHGLGGHPYKTWTSKCSQTLSPPQASTSSRSRSRSPNAFKRGWRSISCSHISDEEDDLPVPAARVESKATGVYWPRDLLSFQCGSRSLITSDITPARILTYGYDSHVTKGYANSDKSNIFAHAKNLLYCLHREKPLRRRIIFVAHSLGGILVKEVLRRSESSDEPEIQDIVKSTEGIIFLGTPHRGSPGFADLGDLVRRIVSMTLRVDSNATLLRALGADSPELELGRESFITQWRTFNFRVKTFQEAIGLSGVNIGPLNEKVVPDSSSSLDDPREHAETISANHKDMCRFSSITDPGYRKVSGEIKLMLRNISSQGTELTGPGQEFLQSLYFPEMYVRRKNIQTALDDTCNWLFSTPEYCDWINRQNLKYHHGLLWIKGKPGAGKSTLMKEALRRVEKQVTKTSQTTAGFFFNARGTEQLEKSPLGLFRSLLHQVLQQDYRTLSHFVPGYLQRKLTERHFEWHQEDLQDFLFETYASSESRPAFVFVDALDECNENEVRQLVDFFRRLTEKACKAGANLNVCLSSRHYPHISIDRCPEVVVERHNEQDILLYIQAESKHEKSISALQDKIFQKSSGVFLWVVLVVSMLKKISHGKSLKLMERKLAEVPRELDTLFRALFHQLDLEDAPKAVCLMRLVLFAEERLKLSEIHCALAFGVVPFRSIRAWKESDEFLADSKKQREMIIDLSRGLLEEVSTKNDIKGEDATQAENNIKTKPNTEQTLQFIHESVRDFFLKGDGFKLLIPSLDDKILGAGHSSIASACVNYLQVTELSDLAASQQQDKRTNGNKGENESALAEHPFLSYVAKYLFLHIEAAESNGVSQKENLKRLGEHDDRLVKRLKLLCPKSFALDLFEHGGTLLYNVSVQRLVACASRLIEMGADVNQPAWTALKYPLLATIGAPSGWGSNILGDCEPTVRMLLQKGADVSLSNDWLQTALHLAAACTNNPNVLSMLISYQAEVNAVDSDGETPLHRAPFSWRTADEIIDVLVQHGARLDVPDKRRNTPLHSAVKVGYLKAVQQLVRAGCSLDLQNNQGETALHRSVKRFADLKDRVSIDKSDSFMKGDFGIVECLVEAGADVKLLDNQGQLAVDIAKKHGACDLIPEIGRLLSPNPAVP